MGFPNAQMAVHFRVEMTLLGAQVVTEPPMPPSRRARVIREVVVKPAAADAAPPRRAVTMAEKLAALDARANEEPEEEPEEGAEQGAEEEEEEADAAQAESSYDRAEEVARQQQQDALDREAAHLAQIDSRANQQLNRVNSYPGQLPPASGGGCWLASARSPDARTTCSRARRCLRLATGSTRGVTPPRLPTTTSMLRRTVSRLHNRSNRSNHSSSSSSRPMRHGSNSNNSTRSSTPPTTPRSHSSKRSRRPPHRSAAHGGERKRRPRWVDGCGTSRAAMVDREESSGVGSRCDGTRKSRWHSESEEVRDVCMCDCGDVDCRARM